MWALNHSTDHLIFTYRRKRWWVCVMLLVNIFLRRIQLMKDRFHPILGTIVFTFYIKDKNYVYLCECWGIVCIRTIVMMFCPNKWPRYCYKGPVINDSVIWKWCWPWINPRIQVDLMCPVMRECPWLFREVQVKNKKKAISLNTYLTKCFSGSCQDTMMNQKSLTGGTSLVCR